MVYEPNVPLTGQSLGETRDPIKNNFTDIDTAFGANHVALTTDTSGKHTFLQMPEQSSAPTTVDNEAAFYTKQSASVANFFVHSQNSATTGKEYQLTSFSSTTDTNSATFGTNPGWTFLPGGLIMQYKTITPAANSGTETFGFAFPNNIFSVFSQIQSSTTAGKIFFVSNATTSSFVWRMDNRTALIGVYYIAIGN